MSAIKTRCPGCKALLAITLPGDGETACACPKCGTKFRPTPVSGASGGASMLVLGLSVLAVIAVLSVCMICVAGWWFSGPRPSDQPKTDIVFQPPDRKTDPPPKKTDEVPPKPPVKTDTPIKIDDKPPPKVEPKEKPLVPFEALAPQERLREIKAIRLKATVRGTEGGPVKSLVIAWEPLRRMKVEETVEKETSTRFFYRDHGWVVQKKESIAMSGADLLHAQHQNYVMVLSNLLPLLEDEFDIEKAGERNIKGKACSGVTVKREAQEPVHLYFDKETGLLLKADTRIAPLGGGPSVFTEFYYTDYRQYGDYKHWRIREEWRDGKAFEQMTVTEANLYTQAHELLFKTPDIEEKLPAVIAEYHVRDRRDFVRRSVAAIGPGEGSDFTRLVAALKNKEPVKSKVRRALVVWGDLARGGNAAPLAAADLDALVALLKTKDDAELQMIGVEGAASLGAQAKDVAAPLAGVAREARDPKLLAGAFLAFRAIGAKDDDTIALMQKHASHADAAVRDAVGLALLKLAPERISIGVAAELMSSPSAEIRTSAGKIMQQQLEKVTVNDLPVLRNGLKNQGREVRLTFIEAIGKLKEEGRAAAPELTALLGLADEEVARQAALTLHQMGKLTEAARGVTDAKALSITLETFRTSKATGADVLAVCEKHLEHPDASVKGLAAVTLIELGPDRLTVDQLADLTGKLEDATARTAVAKHLRHKLGKVTAKDVPALRQGIKNSVREVRLAFLDSVAVLGKDGKPLAADLMPLVAAHKKDADVAIAACHALGSMGNPGDDAVTALGKVVDEGEKNVALAAAAALAKLDPDRDVMRQKGIRLLIDDIRPDIADLDAFLAKPLKSKSTASVADLGEFAVDPIMMRMLIGNRASIKGNDDAVITATRLVGYELIKDLVKRAKTTKDTRLWSALQKHESWLKVNGVPDEADLSQRKVKSDMSRLYSRTARSAQEAYSAVLSLRTK